LRNLRSPLEFVALHPRDIRSDNLPITIHLSRVLASGWFRTCRAILIALLALALSAASSFAETVPLQEQAQFETAIRDASTSPYLVLVTAVDDRTGVSWTGCIPAPLLKGAIRFELQRSDEVKPTASVTEAVQIALGNQSHVFHFSKPNALINLTPLIKGQYREACEMLKSRGCVRLADLTGQPTYCFR
jgi:hypothetical protein